MKRLAWPSLLIVAATIAGPARAGPGHAEARGRCPRTTRPGSSCPQTLAGGGSRLPTWARATARDLPRTTAAMLDLDRLHRTKSPLGPSLRGKMRWVAADANRCEYARATAEADLRRAGVSEAEIADLKAGRRWSKRRARRPELRLADDRRRLARHRRPGRRPQGVLRRREARRHGPAARLGELPGPDDPRAGRTPRGRRPAAARST